MSEKPVTTTSSIPRCSLIMDIRALSDELAATSSARFYAAVGALRGLTPEEGVQLLEHLAWMLDANPSLTDLTKNQRLVPVLKQLNVDQSQLEKIINNEPTLSIVVRNTLARFLPAARRRSATNGEAASPPKRSNSAPTAVDPGTTLIDSAIPLGTGVATVEQEFEPSAVVALSLNHTQDSNRRLITGKDFTFEVIDSVAKLQEDLQDSSDVSGFLLDSSIMAGQTEEEQRHVLRLVGGYSTFAWIRIDRRGLKLAHEEVERIIQDIRGATGPIEARTLSYEANGAVGEAELPWLERARDSLRAHRRVSVVPGELDEKQTRLLVAAAQDYAREYNVLGGVKISSLTTTFIPGGLSGASIAVVRIGDEGHQVVAKIADKDRVLDEIRRFRIFIQNWDDQLRPKVYLHGGSGVVLFALLRVNIASREPAPTLFKALNDLWISEVFDQPSVQHDHDELYLTNAVVGVAVLLESLNSMAPPAGECLDVVHPGDESILKRLDARGITWGLSDKHLSARSKAAARYAVLHGRARVHGDLHLKNVLVRGHDDVHLIDYAASGPGHPAVDLVRFELALFLSFARPLITEQEFVEFQEALSLERVGVEELMVRFPALNKCRINKVAIAGCVAARDRALSTLAKHGGGPDDYLAAKYLIAWQSLLLIDRQTLTARSIIVALEPELNVLKLESDARKKALEVEITISKALPNPLISGQPS